MGSPVRFDLSNGSKELRVRIGYDFVTDLPGTKEFQTALWSYLSAKALRFSEPDSSEYITLSGVPLRFRIEFPFGRSPEGGSFDFVHVLTRSGHDMPVEANFTVHLSRTIAAEIVSLESVITEALVVNSVRRFIDGEEAVFYPQGEHPADLQVVTIGSSNYDYKTKRFVYHKTSNEDASNFLRRKVYWLGFRRGNQATRVCIADPYDAAYLGVSTERLQQAGAILAADGFVQTDSSGLYASAGTKLLQEARRLDSELAVFFGTKSPMGRVVQMPSITRTPEDSFLFDVFVSHATEDKAYVGPLVQALEEAGIRVWFDKATLEWGDDLRPAIDRGLTNCRYGIVVFSQAFLRKKKWTEYELNSLFAREQSGKKLILPIWHGITHDDLIQYSPAFADRFAKLSSTDSYADIVASLLSMLGRPGTQEQVKVNVAQLAPKPDAVAYAHYETKGENAARAESYVRPSTQKEGWFTFENSFGEEEHGTKEEIAQRFAAFDKSLTLKHYVRMRHGSSDPAFNL